MREEDAKNKWCPMTRFHTCSDDHVYSNKLISDNNISGMANRYSANCITTNCMMWVETDNETTPCRGENANDRIYYPAGHCGLVK